MKYAGVLEFRILGPLEAWRDGEQIPIGAPRERAFLAALLLQPNRLVSADRLIELLWGDDEAPPKARHTLHTWAWRLRRRLEPPQVVVTQPPGYLLRIQPAQVDAFRFEETIQRGRSALAAGDMAQAVALLGDALDLWRGQPLADVASDRLRQVEVPRLSELYLQAVEARTEAQLALGRHADLVGELVRLVADHPLREGLNRHLMAALYRCGRQAEALEVYRVLQRALRDEFGTEPGPETRRLQLAILRADTSLDAPAVAAGPATAADPGRARAPDEGQPARAAGAPAEPAEPGRRVPAQLPADVSAFTGRRAHLEQLDRLLSPAQDPTAVVICVIAGTAGIGKTALALHWAHRVRRYFPDGQLHVNLRGYSPATPMRPIEVLSRFLHALGVPPGRVPIDVDEAADLHRTLLAGRQMLLVLDNARDADQVRPLLPGSSGCLVLVTSRDRLTGLVAAEGARRLTVDVLSPDEAHDLLRGTVGDDRLARDPGAVAELAEACAYLPLALRIAAANLINHPHESVAGYVGQLRAGNRLAALAVEGDDRAAVRAAFDVSYRALPPAAQKVFRLLGLVPGPDVTAPAVAAMAGTTAAEAAGLLDRLAAAHLVDEPAAGRYACHDLLRLYAGEHAERHLAETDRLAAVERLLGYYQRTADGAADLLYPEKLRLTRPEGAQPTAHFHEPGQALAWLDAERPNLVAAVRHAAEHGPHPVAWLLADTLRGYFFLRMFVVDWQSVTRAGLAAARAECDLRGQAAAHLSLADLAWRSSANDRAVDHYTQALRMSRETDWVAGEASVLGNLGTVYWQRGQMELAAEHFRKALAINQRIGRVPGQATSLGNLATVAWQSGRLAEAAGYHADALTLHRKTGSRGGEALAHNNIGETYHQLGRIDEAVDHLTQALALHREIGNRGSEGETLRCLAAVHRDAGRLDAAAEFAEGALALARETGNRRHELEAVDTLATVHQRSGENDRAAEGHRLALSLAQDSGHRYAEVEALLGLAVAHRHLGQLTQAEVVSRQALSQARTDGYRFLEGQATNVLGAVYLAQDQPASAAGMAEQGVEVNGETGHLLGVARAHLILAEALDRLGDAAGARTQRRLARDLLAELGVPEADEVRGLSAR